MIARLTLLFIREKNATVSEAENKLKYYYVNDNGFF
jgi:hypothetical protein